MSGVSGEYKDLQKFAPDSDSHRFGEELEDSLKKAKDRRYSLKAPKQCAGDSQAHKRKANADTDIYQVKKLQASQKALDWPKGFSTNKQTTSSSKTRFSYQESSQRSQELRKHIDLQNNQKVSHDKFFLHEEVKNIQAGNICKHVKTWEKITDSYIVDTVKNGIKIVFLKAPVYDFYPH